jgi:phosphoribosylglycinamide formyltransferase-1
LNQLPLGVTLHYINAEVDAGQTIAILETPVFLEDDLATLARRHYELELDVLCEFFALSSAPNPLADRYPSNPPRRRMPIDREREMLGLFPSYKTRFAGSSFADWTPGNYAKNLDCSSAATPD